MGMNNKQFNVKLTEEQTEIIKGMLGIMGGTEAEVIRNIIIAWLSEKSIISDLIKKRWLDKQK